jgi:hypothetical protein
MSTIIRIKRRLEGEAGPPPVLDAGEFAYNEVDDTLYIGVSTPSLSSEPPPEPDSF